MEDEIRFLRAPQKEVLNAADGSRLGHIVDMIVSVETRTALGIVAPGKKSGLFGKDRNVFIPFGCIVRIGEDVILVDLLPRPIRASIAATTSIRRAARTADFTNANRPRRARGA